MGDKPTEMDCSLIGMLSMVVWAMPDSSYEKLVNGKLSRSSKKKLILTDLTIVGEFRQFEVLLLKNEKDF